MLPTNNLKVISPADNAIGKMSRQNSCLHYVYTFIYFAFNPHYKTNIHIFSSILNDNRYFIVVK